MVKGDYHNIHNNTVFNSSGKNDMIILTDDGVCVGGPTRTTATPPIHQNAPERPQRDVLGEEQPRWPITDVLTPASWSSYPLPSGDLLEQLERWCGYVNTTDSVWNQLVDPGNEDFRPKANSHLPSA